MCDFFSFVILRPVGHSEPKFYEATEYTDSHEDLIEHFNLKKQAEAGKLVRIEYKPTDNKYTDLSKYVFRVDEEATPDWFSDEIKESAINWANDKILSMIIKDKEIDLLLGGVHILGNGAKIKASKNARIKAMVGNAQVGEMQDSSQVGKMWDSSQVGKMGINAKAPRKPTTRA